MTNPGPVAAAAVTFMTTATTPVAGHAALAGDVRGGSMPFDGTDARRGLTRAVAGVEQAGGRERHEPRRGGRTGR